MLATSIIEFRKKIYIYFKLEMYKEYLWKVLLKGIQSCETLRDQGNVAAVLTVLIKEDRWSKT